MTDQAAKPRRGCFFYGCITSLVLLVIVLVGILAALHYAKKLVNLYTDTQPVELPTVQMPPGDVDKLKQRFAAFQDAVRGRRVTEPLVLTADDINALIASGPGQQDLKGKFYVNLEGDQCKAELSLPLNMFKGRYLNGSGTFNLAFRNGVLFVSPQTVTVKGKPLPENYMREIRKQNLAAKLASDPEAAAVLQGLEDIQVKDGKLLLLPKDKK